MTPNTPALKMLMMGYLHQDYRLIGDVQANVEEFIANHPDLAPLVPPEVSTIVSELSEPEAAEHVRRLGAEVRPPAGVTYREWLTQIADRVRRDT